MLDTRVRREPWKARDVPPNCVALEEPVCLDGWVQPRTARVTIRRVMSGRGHFYSDQRQLDFPADDN